MTEQVAGRERREGGLSAREVREEAARDRFGGHGGWIEHSAGCCWPTSSESWMLSKHLEDVVHSKEIGRIPPTVQFASLRPALYSHSDRIRAYVLMLGLRPRHVDTQLVSHSARTVQIMFSFNVCSVRPMMTAQHRTSYQGIADQIRDEDGLSNRDLSLRFLGLVRRALLSAVPCSPSSRRPAAHGVPLGLSSRARLTVPVPPRLSVSFSSSAIHLPSRRVSVLFQGTRTSSHSRSA